jgi:hypothetical protein
MSDARPGIERLREVVDDVAASLPPPRRARRRPLRPLAWALAGAAVVVAALLLGRWWHREVPPRPVVEVLSLQFRGREVRARVVESKAAGSIVVVPLSPEPGRPQVEGGIR